MLLAENSGARAKPRFQSTHNALKSETFLFICNDHANNYTYLSLKVT